VIVAVEAPKALIELCDITFYFTPLHARLSGESEMSRCMEDVSDGMIVLVKSACGRVA
jgi:hypothetical protein